MKSINNTKRASGFTLVELMIVVAILGIIMAIAYPNYTQHLVKTRRAVAAGCLTESATALERYRTTAGNLSYTGGPVAACNDPNINEYYTFGSNIAADSFTLTAQPKATQSDSTCGTLSLTNTGVKGADGSVQACW